MNDYQQLRTLLLAEEQQRIDQLEQRIIDLQSRSQDVATVLPQALKITPDISELIDALQQPVDNCVRQTVQVEPESFAEPLHPLLVEPLRIEIAQLVKKIRKILHSHKVHISELDSELDQLEQQQIQAILKRIARLEADLKDTEKRTLEIAKSLPDAIRRASAEDGHANEMSDAELAESLQVPVTRCIQQSISQDAKALADTLFPIMGPAIRRSINESIKEFLQSVNAAVEQSLSVKGMLWRFEAFRTGQSFADVILQKTLVYRVEQVFLVHKESGLLIQHLSQDGVEVGDSDAVSAMLTAIQDFIRDSFTAEGDLEKVELGNYTVWLDQSPYAVLACVVRGNASYKLRSVMKQSLETIHARYGRLLEVYEGDPDPLEPCRAILQKNLQMKELKEGAKKRSRFFSPPLIAVSALIAIGVAIWLFMQLQEERHLRRYIHTLRDTAGLMVIETKRDDGKLIVRGLRDPLATDPNKITAQFALQDKVLNEWGTYQDLAPQFVLQRARQALNPPESVSVDLRDNKLYISGEADNDWIEQATLKQGLLGGIQQVVMDDLQNRQQYWLDTKREFQALVDTLDAVQGIQVAEVGIKEGKRFISGLRDPLTIDPQVIAQEFKLNDVLMEWTQYQALFPEFILQRAKQALNPPDNVSVTLAGKTLLITGEADHDWIEQVALKQGMLSGVDQVDTSALIDKQQYWIDTQPLFNQLLTELDDSVGLKVVDSGIENGQYFVKGLRDPLAPNPQDIVKKLELEDVAMQWTAYQDLNPDFVLRRAKQALTPPESVSLSVNGNTLLVQGRADNDWIEKLRLKQGMLAGIQQIDSSKLYNQQQYWIDTEPAFQNLLEELETIAGLKVLDSGIKNDRRFIKGLKDPLAQNPQPVLDAIGLGVVAEWQPYHDLSPRFVLQRAKQALHPPASIALDIDAQTLIFSGHAPQQWIDLAIKTSHSLAGIEQLDTTQLQNTDNWLWAQMADQLPHWVDVDFIVKDGQLQVSGLATQSMRDRLQQQLADLNITANFNQLRSAEREDLQYQIDAFIAVLHQTIGLSVTEVKQINDKTVVYGLKDPLAMNPDLLAADYGLTSTHLETHWTPYQDLHPQFVEQRAIKALTPPEGVQVSLKDDVLHVTGHADDAWISYLKQTAQLLPHIKQLDISELGNNEAYWVKTRPQFNQLVKALNETLGILVVSSGIENEQWFITGFRDPLARDPVEIAQKMDMAEVMMRWTPYQDLNPIFIEQRALQALEPPETVQLRLEGDVLYLSGHAPQQWMEKAVNSVNLIAGVNQLTIDDLQQTDQILLQQAQTALRAPDTVNLTVRDKHLYVSGVITQQAREQLMKKLDSLQGFAKVDTQNLLDATTERRKQVIAKIETTMIYFKDDESFATGQNQILQDLIKNIRLLLRFNKQLKHPLRIQITGHTDGLGTLTYNRQLGQQRVETVRDWLQTQGITSNHLLLTQPSLIRFGETVSSYQDRKVTLKVVE
ncbi:OmpA family protein [Candidatus Albibeggiatoa sp. nov. NOAA]|uniref:OmpA family protein n=1 Tax=Candidatus Albibeggiatoa sp. nov. NOAA TaxID=3162724 RepID=UPI0033048276|nr:OmpA family protein [Thiotrichaceae bacterium]